MNKYKLTRCLLGLFVATGLYVNTAHAGMQTGVCSYRKYMTGQIVLLWTMNYDDMSTVNTVKTLEVKIGGIAPTSFAHATSSVNTGRQMPNGDRYITYGGFALTGLSKLVFPTPDNVILHVPHKDTHISEVLAKSITSLTINKGENPRNASQKWTLSYWRGIRPSHADLTCNVSGPSITGEASSDEGDQKAD